MKVTLMTPIGKLALEGDENMVEKIYFVDDINSLESDSSDELGFGELLKAKNQLNEYFQGGRQSFSFNFSKNFSPFQEKVLTKLLEVNCGETVSYSQLAVMAGNKNAARAVGIAVGRNPLAVVVPCHRVMGKSGKLTGYHYGIERKKWLLELEKSTASIKKI